MQHDHVLKKLIFHLLTPSPSVVEGGGSAGKIFATMLLHLRFPLIWYATGHCSEKLNFDPMTPSPGSGWGMGEGSACKILATLLLNPGFPLILYVA